MSLHTKGSWGTEGCGRPGAQAISWCLQSPAGVLMPKLGITVGLSGGWHVPILNLPPRTHHQTGSFSAGRAFRKLTVRAEAYLLACISRQLHALNKDADGFLGE